MSHDPRADGDEAGHAKIAAMIKNPRAEKRVAEQAGAAPVTSSSGATVPKPSFLSDTAYARALRIVGAAPDAPTPEPTTSEGAKPAPRTLVGVGSLAADGTASIEPAARAALASSDGAAEARADLVATAPVREDGPTLVEARVEGAVALEPELVAGEPLKRLPEGRRNDPTFVKGLSRVEHDAARAELDEKRNIVASMAMRGLEPADRIEDLEPLAEELVRRKGGKALAPPASAREPVAGATANDAAAFPSPRRGEGREGGPAGTEPGSAPPRQWMLVLVAAVVIGGLAIAWALRDDDSSTRGGVVDPTAIPEPMAPPASAGPLDSASAPASAAGSVPEPAPEPLSASMEPEPQAAPKSPPPGAAPGPSSRPSASSIAPPPSSLPAPKPSASATPKWGKLGDM